MNLIVISSPVPVPSEADIINALFDAGLDCFHLRKPGIIRDELVSLMESISPDFWPKIAWHQEHDIASEFLTNRFHFPVKMRNATDPHSLGLLKENQAILSTSTHTIAELDEIPFFEYAFFGPVYDSISKPDYQNAITSDFKIPNSSATKMIALGGITASKIPEIRKLNFHGAALLGAIWNEDSSKNPELAIKAFLEAQKVIQTTVKH